MPTGGHWVVRTVAEGLEAIDSYPAVIKADGLAAGKGVVIAADEAEARAALVAMLEERRFGDQPVLVEELLVGDELSRARALRRRARAAARARARLQAHRRRRHRAPTRAGWARSRRSRRSGPELLAEIVATVHQPVVDEMRNRGNPFQGVLYAGLMLTADGPRVLEFNVRFGDPETQVVLPRLRSDLLDLLLRATRPGGLAGVELEWDERAAVTVVLASPRLPGVVLLRRRHPRPGPHPARGRGDPRGDRRGRRRGGHGGRPRAQRDRARRRTSLPPATPRMLPPT